MKSKLSISPRISIVIPAANAANSLQQAVESVINQTYTDYEIIVIDDGSIDNTRDLLNSYIEAESIDYIYRNNQGLSLVLQHGLQMAHGDFVIFLDPQNSLLPNMLADIVACFDARPSLGMVVSGYSRIEDGGKLLSSVEPWHQFPQLNLSTWLLWKPIPLSTIMFRRELLEDLETLFDAEYFPMENLELIIRLALRGVEATWSHKIGVCCSEVEGTIQDVSKLEGVLNTLYDRFFAKSELPQKIVALEDRIRYNYLVWVSWCAYQNGQFQAMADYLHKSLFYTSSLPSEIVSAWTEQLINYARIYGKPINAYQLNKLLEWQTLIAYILMPKQPCLTADGDITKNVIESIYKTYEYNSFQENFWQPNKGKGSLSKYLAFLGISQVTKPKVSIITSVFKGDKYIEPFLKDITAQTVFNRCELILINPNSPGNEEPAIVEYMKKYSNIIYQKLDSDPGIYETWNMAIRMARGEYITNANLDDRHSPQHMEKHLELLENNPEYDVACAPVLVTKGVNETWDNHTAYTVWYEHFGRGENEYSGVQDFFQPVYEDGIKTGGVISYNFPHCMPVWRKSVHEQNGYFDEAKYGTSADWEFWLRCAANGSKFKLIPEPLGLYLEDPNSHNRTYKNKEQFEEQIIAKYISYAKKPLVFINNSKGSISVPRSVDLSGTFGGDYGNHRSGWGYAVQSLKPLHNELGIWVDSFIEKKFVWGNDPGDRKNNPQPYRKPWIGFIHVPPQVPRWFQSEQAPQTIFNTKLWQKSIEYCQGLFCLSKYHQAWLAQHLDVTVNSLIHPTETPDLKFSFAAFQDNPERKVVQIGWWLRKLHSIYYLPVQKIKKAILRLPEPHIEEMFLAEKKVMNLNPDESSVEQIAYLSNDEYDELLANNIVYVELYDTSANNVVIECIVRNTPILVNPLPAVKEYLGTEYPFYFESPEEAARKAEDMGLIEETYKYLQFHPIKEKLTAEYFLQSFAESEIYNSL